jgi:hypothetical protein
VAPNQIPPDLTKSLWVEPPRSQELGRIPAVRKPAALPLQNRQGSSCFGFLVLREIGWDLIDLLRVFRRWVRWSGYGHAMNPNGVLGRNLFGIGMKAREMGQESQP